MFSKDLFQESKKFIPGGVSSPVRAFEPYPFFVKKASGSKIYDVDGNKYIDHCLAYGPLILGHADPKVVREVSNQLTIGSAYGAPTENEIILAKEVVDRIPSAEMVRFVNSGGEATMSAIRLARGLLVRIKSLNLMVLTMVLMIIHWLRENLVRLVFQILKEFLLIQLKTLILYLSMMKKL